MKKLFFATLLAFMLVACNQQGEDYKITINFADDAANGQAAYLTSYDTGDTLNLGVVTDKMVIFQGKVDTTYMARVLVEGKRLGMVVEPGEVTVNWDEHKAEGAPLNDKLNALNAEIEQLMKSAEGSQDEQAMLNAERQVSERFFKAYEENKDNGIGPWAFNYYLMYNEFTYEQIDSLVNAAPARYRNLTRVQKALNSAKQLVATAVGKQFTDFTDASGVKLSDFAGKGKYTLVDFWASWCGPCRREIPNIKELYNAYKDKMNFVGVAVWDKPEDTKKAIEQLQMPWPVMEGGQNWTEPTDLYGINGIPHIMLIDPDGKIIARQLAGEQLTKAVKDLKL